MCTRKHTKYQPYDKHWRCPNCGEREGFIIDNDYLEDDGECEKIHVDDCCICENCGYGELASKAMNALMKLDHQVICPICKGKGTIDESKNL